MKYRILKTEELKHLELQLKQFLIVNGIDGDEWKRINEEDADKAIELVEIFSDQVLQVVYEKIFYLEKRTKDAFFVFHCKHEKIELIVVQIKKGEESSEIDLSTEEGIQDALSNHTNQLVLFQSEKKYDTVRELEIHKLFTDGCIISNREFWDKLRSLVSNR